MEFLKVARKVAFGFLDNFFSVNRSVGEVSSGSVVSDIYGEDSNEERPAYILGLRASAIFESLFFLIIITAASYIFGDGNRYINISPHPFWVVVLLITIQYGTKEAIVCVGLSSAFLLLGNMPSQEVQTTYEYFLEVSSRPFLWLVASVIIGELRVRQIKERSGLQKDLSISDKETKAITKAYTRMKVLKEGLETRLAGEMRSAVAIYDAAKALRSLDREQVLEAVEEVILSSMNPHKFSLYMLEGNGFAIARYYGWSKESTYVKHFPSDTPIYRQIVGDKRVLCIVNAEDEGILSGQGLLAGPLIDSSTGQIFGMLKIEEMGFSDLGMHTVETFRILCEWIGLAYANAGKYQFAKEDSIINYDQMLFSHNFYKRQCEFMKALAKRVGFNLSVINIRLVNSSELEEEENNKCAKALGEAVNATLRKIDHIFNEQRAETSFAILLPGTKKDDAITVVNKIRHYLSDHSPDTISKARYQFSIQVLHEQDEGWQENKSRWVEEV